MVRSIGVPGVVRVALSGNTSTSKGLNWNEFVANYGDNERYELIDGELIDMEPTGPHEQVAALVSRKIDVEIDRGDLPYFIPHRCLIRPFPNIVLAADKLFAFGVNQQDSPTPRS